MLLRTALSTEVSVSKEKRLVLPFLPSFCFGNAYAVWSYSSPPVIMRQSNKDKSPCVKEDVKKKKQNTKDLGFLIQHRKVESISKPYNINAKQEKDKP